MLQPLRMGVPIKLQVPIVQTMADEPWGNESPKEIAKYVSERMASLASTLGSNQSALMAIKGDIKNLKTAWKKNPKVITNKEVAEMLKSYKKQIAILSGENNKIADLVKGYVEVYNQVSPNPIKEIHIDNQKFPVQPTKPPAQPKPPVPIEHDGPSVPV